MPPERGLHQHQRGARTVGQRHRGQRQCLQRIGRERDDQVVRQRGQRMRQRLAGMALAIEPELRLQRGEPRAQDGHVARRRGERGAGPQAGVDRQAGDLAVGLDRQDDQIDRHRPVDGRDQAGFQQQWRGVIAAVPVEPRRRQGLRRLRQDRRRMRVARDAQHRAHALRAVPELVTEQGEVAIEKPLQQRRAFALRQGRFVRRHGALQLRPVRHRRAHVRQHRGQIVDQRPPVAGIDPVHLDIDQRFGGPRAADLGQRAGIVARHSHDGVDDPIDRDVARTDRGRDRIDQERHVVVDDRQPHPAPGVVGRDRLDRDSRRTRGADQSGRDDERGGGGDLRGAKSRQFARKRALGQPGGKRVRQR